jgi:flavin-dependent dehydrogenase
VAAAIVERGAFDTALGAQASSAGAMIRTGVRAEDITLHDDHVAVRHADGSQSTGRVGVLACGARYRFHRRLGLGLPRHYLQSAQIEMLLPSTTDIDVQFGRDVAPGGFAWRVPFYRGSTAYARIGVMCESAAADRLHRFARAFPDAAGIDPAAMLRPRRRMLPLGPVRRTVAHRLVAVGDAAGLVKPTTGGGIYFGLLSGHLAAEILDEQLRQDRLDARSLQRYEHRWQERLGPDIRAGLAFRRLVTRLDDSAIESLIALARTDGIVPLLKRTAVFNWHRGAVTALLRHGEFRKILLRALLA